MKKLLRLKGMLFLAAMMLVGASAQRVQAAATVDELDFVTFVTHGVDITNTLQLSEQSVEQQGTNAKTVYVADNPVATDETILDLKGRIALDSNGKTANQKRWILRGGSGNAYQNGLVGNWNGNGAEVASYNISILNLHQGDKVTITFVIRSGKDATPYTCSANAISADGTALGAGEKLTSGTEYTVLADGNLDLYVTDDNLAIQKIVIESDDDASDPALAEAKATLSQVLALVESLMDELDSYTEESAENFMNAYNAAKAALEADDATVESLTDALNGLYAAYSALEEKPKDSVDEGTWKTVGTAILEDPWVLPGLGIDQHDDANKWEVPLERNTANENLYRLVDPYHAGPAKASNESKKIGYITFDVTDPDHVIVLGTDAAYVNTTFSTEINKFYAYNRLGFYLEAFSGMYDAAGLVEALGDQIPYTTYKNGVITLGSMTDEEGVSYDACYKDLKEDAQVYDWDGPDMTGTITLKINETDNETVARRWDFTQWSEATVANLKAEAAASKVEGWSDVEKTDDAEADKEPTETSKDNCFWAAKTMKADEIYGLSANGIVIDELKGLKFTGALDTRNLAIAVNYPEALSEYEGGAYLWLGGKNKQFFTIPAVAGGSTIKMGVESHNTGDARGVNLLVNGASIGEFTPTVYEEHIWTVPAGEAVDVVVDNTNGCHIYFIEVEQDQEALLAVATADLKTVIAAAEAIEDLSIYTEESVEALNAALTAAKAAEGTIEAQTEAAYALLDAKAALVEIIVEDPLAEVKEALNQAIVEAEAIDKSLYTAETADALTKAIEDGKAALEAADATEATLTAAIAAIADAVAALEELDVEVYDFQELCMALYPTYGAGPYAVNNGGDAGFTVDGATMHYLGDYTDEGFAWNQRFAYEYVEKDGEDRAKFTMRNKSNKIDGNCGMFSWDYAHKFSILGLRNGDQVKITVGAGTVTFVSTNVEGEVEAGSSVVSDQVYTISTEEKTTRLDIEMPAASLIAKILIYNTGEAVGDDEPTGINAINAEAGNGAVYNLQGQKVEKAQKGLYIINGKKVVVK